MISQEFGALVFIGRFHPVHLGHLKVFEEGLRRAHKLYVLVGSTEQPRTLRNPFTFAERAVMIRACLSAAERTEVLPLPDIVYNDEAWIDTVQDLVDQQLRKDGLNPASAQVGLVGHNKDASSYYLGLFPQWRSVGVAPYKALSATSLRDNFFRNGVIDRANLPEPTIDFLEEFKTRAAYAALRQDRVAIDACRKAWETSPYPPTFVTVDAVVVQSGQVLLVERRAFPGKGLSALPGGFVRAEEPLRDALLRRLRKETGLRVPDPVLRASIKGSQVFDDPHRSMRGRTITHAYLVQLSPQTDGLPTLENGNRTGDAKAFWLPLANLTPLGLYEDHYHIIQAMLPLAD